MDFRSQFQFQSYKIDEINFKINNEFKGDLVEIDADFDVGFQLDEKNKEALIVLNCSIFDEFLEKNYPFFLHVRIIGHFRVEGDMESQSFLRFCEVNGTAALFPYLRMAISNITLLAGMVPLNLPLINIHKLLDEKKKEIANMENEHS